MLTLKLFCNESLRKTNCLLDLKRAVTISYGNLFKRFMCTERMKLHTPYGIFYYYLDDHERL